jgi:hypothetical protein
MKPSDSHFVEIGIDLVHGSRLLTAVSYEPRFIESLRRTLSKGSFSEVHLLVFRDYFDEGSAFDSEAVLNYRRNYEKATELIRASGADASPVRLALDDLPSFVSTITEFDTANLIVDISTFPRSYVLLLLRFAQPSPVALVYTRGRARRTEEDAYTVGVRDVVALPGFEGEVGHKPTLLVLSLGYEGARAYKLFRQYEPTATLALLGDPGDMDAEREHILETVKRNNANLLATDAVCYRTLPSYDPVAFADQAETYIDQMIEHIRLTHGSEVDVIVSPIGTKIQALGLFQLWQRRQNYQVAYPVPSVRRLGTAEVGPTLGYLRVTG